MNKSELKEAVGLAQQVLTALLGTVTAQSGMTGAQLRTAVGALQVAAATELNSDDGPAQFFADLANCFELARLAGADYASMDAVRVLAETFTPAQGAGVAVMNFSARVALAELAQILSATPFDNRADIDSALDLINDAFDAAELVAADNQDNVAYVALITLHGAVANDLSTRALPLPAIVTYTFPQRMSALWIAQRLYQDPSRTGELIGENRPVHPLFMPETGRALSA